MSVRRALPGALLSFSVLAAVAPPAASQEIEYTSVSRDARSFFRAGTDLWNNLYASSAAEQFQKAVEIDPRFAMAYLYLARVADTYTDYRTNLDKAVELVDEVSDGEQMVIRSYQARHETRFADEERHLRRLLALYPGDVDAHYHRADVAFANDDYHETVHQLEQAIMLNDEFPPAYNLLGYAYAHLGDFDSAVRTLESYARLIPDQPNPHDSLGEVLLMAGRFEESLEEYTNALAIDPAFYSAHLGRGHGHLFMGKKQMALDEYAKAIAVAPTPAVRREALRWIAIAELYDGNHDAALDQLHTVRKEEMDAGDVWTACTRSIELAWIHNDRNDSEAALAELERAWRDVMESDLPEARKRTFARRHHVAAGACAAGSGDLARAETAAEQVRRLAEKSEAAVDWEDYNWLMGEILLARDEAQSAVANLMHGPKDNPRVSYLLGVAFERRGAHDRAREQFEAVRNWNRPDLLYAMSRSAAERALTMN